MPDNPRMEATNRAIRSISRRTETSKLSWTLLSTASSPSTSRASSKVQPGMEQLFGYAPAELIGRNVSVLMPSPHREDHDEYIARLRTGEARVIGIGREVEGLRRDGTIFPMELAISEVRGGDAGASPASSATSPRASRRRRHCARARRGPRPSLDTLSMASSPSTNTASSNRANPAVERLFGYTRELVLGRNVSMLMPSPYREHHDEYVRATFALVRRGLGIGREVEGLPGTARSSRWNWRSARYAVADRPALCRHHPRDYARKQAEAASP